MLLAQYRISASGEIVSDEMPQISVDESARLTRVDYKDRPSILLEVISESGRVAEQIMFAGLAGGRFGVGMDAG